MRVVLSPFDSQEEDAQKEATLLLLKSLLADVNSGKFEDAHTVFQSVLITQKNLLHERIGGGSEASDVLAQIEEALQSNVELEASRSKTLVFLKQA